MNPWLRLRALLKEKERRRAKDSLAVYCGLHIPAEIEQDDLPGMEKLPIAARYIPAAHHRLLIEKLEAVERGEIKRLAVFMPPGTAKSTYGSVLFPAWYLGKHPQNCVIQGSYNDTLASRFGRRARNVFASETHHSVFGVGLARDSKAAGEWETERGGEYFSFGANTGVTGRRADLVVLDDIIKGRKEADSKTIRDSVWETYKADVRTRLKPNAAIVLIMTRWHEDDPAGRILPKESLGKSGWFEAQDGERWYVLSLPAVIETPEDAKYDPLGRKVGEHIWPEWFSAQYFEQERRTQGSRNWNALYQQKPRPDEGAVLKAHWWKKWPKDKPFPKVGYVVSVYDTAFEEGEEDDYSARTTWGVFEYEEPPPDGATPAERAKHKARPRMCAILLEAWEDKVEFPDLRKLAVEHYFKNSLRLQIDRVAVEKKVSGHSLIQELRRAGVPVMGIPAKESKLLRAHAAAVVFEDGCMFYPEGKRWAENVVEKCAAATFIKGDPGNDTPDCCVHAANWLRKTYHLTTKGDAPDPDDDDTKPQSERSRLFG